ncbi:hypothetical protein DFH11DRAFT_1734799 [Phellopilus nigrolimitatus]|nr:hypothetical protein DFH11DRAFT_1734799 [Phellopilus nigrolimitatus]
MTRPSSRAEGAGKAGRVKGTCITLRRPRRPGWAAIAAVELPNNQLPEIIEILLRFMDGPDNVSLKIATFQATGSICETIKERPLL